MASDNRGLRRTQGPARIPLGVSRAEVESARTDPMDVLVSVAELADALDMDRCLAVRRIRKMPVNVLRVIDNRAGFNKWKLAVSKDDAALFIVEMKRLGFGPHQQREFVDKDGIKEMVKEVA